MKRSIRFLIPAVGLMVLMIGTAAVLYARTSLQRSCEVAAVEEASDLLIHQADRYDDVYRVATNAPRDSVVLPVTTLQLILMDTKQVDVPVCLQSAKDELLGYMGDVIRAFLAYSEEETEETVRELIDRSETHYANFAVEVNTVSECAPLCFP